MRWLRVGADRLRALLGREAVIRDIDEELRAHVEMEAEANVRRGMTPEAARRAALLSFGNYDSVRDAAYGVRGGGVVETLLQDVRYAARMLAKRPGFTAVAVLTLALGIGANTSIFSVVNAVLLRPLPYKDAERLVVVYETDAKGEDFYPAAPANYLAWKARAGSFEELAALSNKGWGGNLTGEGEPERLQGFQVTANLFPFLGASPALGRNFLPEEDRPGGEQVVILSHGLWQRRFAGDTGVVGRTLTINGRGYAVVGVMPQDFRFYQQADLWTPMAFDAAEESNAQDHYLYAVGRLRPGVTPEQARSEAAQVLRAVAAVPAEANSASVVYAQEGLVREVRPVLFLLLGAVGFVLLIACTNVASLMLARAAERRKEIAIRTALGARRRRIVLQLLTESTVVALLGGGLGLLVAMWGVGFLVGVLPGSLVAGNPRLASLGVDAGVLLFTLAVSLLTSLLFGLAPALHASKVDLNEALKEGARSGGAGRARNRLRSVLVVAEVGLALVLLVCAGLMIKSLWRLSAVNPGYDPDGVLALNVDLPGTKYKEKRQIADFYGQAIERISALPGVAGVGAVNSLGVSVGFGVDERPPVEPSRRPQAVTRFVNPGYFAALRIPILRGRSFTEQDRADSAPVAVIDETLARRHFPGEEPIGKHLSVWGASREIVGVVGEARYGSLGDKPSPHVYLPYTQMTWGGMTLFVRSGLDPAALTPAIRREVQAIDPDQSLYDVKMLGESLSESVAPRRHASALLGGFAALALVLAAVGLYGVMAYSVAQRTHELGVRVALGARSADVLKMVLGQGMLLVLIGTVVGLAAAAALTRLIESLLFGVSPTDPATFMVIVLLLVLVSLLACYIPARRATRVDPLTALRYE